MTKEEAQQEAIKRAAKEFWGVAVIYSDDGIEWKSGAHSEERYLESYFEAKHIWTYHRHDRPEWKCYKEPGQPVDYVKETGATGHLAAQLRAIQALRDRDDS